MNWSIKEDAAWSDVMAVGVEHRYMTIMSGNVEVARVWCDEDDAEQNDAVSLIAAAPELLRVCKEMAEIIHSMSEGGAGIAEGGAAPYLEIIRRAEGKA
jgi:hypothetical protein